MSTAFTTEVTEEHRENLGRLSKSEDESSTFLCCDYLRLLWLLSQAFAAGG